MSEVVVGARLGGGKNLGISFGERLSALQTWEHTIFSCKSEVKHLKCLLSAIAHHVLCPRGVAGPQAACSSLVPTMPVGNAT